MSAEFEKKPRLIRFVYESLPLNQRNLEDLLTIVQLLGIDRERVLQITFPGYDDPAEIRVAALQNGYYLGLSFPMEEFDWDHPLVLAAENLSREQVEEVLRGICGERKSTEEIPIVMEELKDVTNLIYGSD